MLCGFSAISSSKIKKNISQNDGIPRLPKYFAVKCVVLCPKTQYNDSKTHIKLQLRKRKGWTV